VFCGTADSKEVNGRQFKVGRERIEEGATPVFSKRVGKPLMPRELAECSSLRSAEECENREVSFCFFCKRAEERNRKGIEWRERIQRCGRMAEATVYFLRPPRLAARI
jgi:hypothetical protein